MEARRLLAAFAGAFALLTRHAAAEENYAFRLSYEVPPGCPTAEAFSEAVTSNSTRAHRASPDETATDIEALASVREGGFLGMLRIRRPDGTESTRSIPAATCKETMSAMAFIAAITIDPDAATAASNDQLSAEVAPPLLPPAAQPATSEIPRVARDATPRHEEEHKRRPWTFGVTASVGLASAIAPDVSPDFGAGVGFGATQRTLWSPLVLLGAQVAVSPSVSNGEGTARFERIGARLTGCPLRIEAATVTIRPCALFELGQYSAIGSQVPNQSSAQFLWSAVGAAVRGELPIAGPLNLALDLGAFFPFARDSFYFNPSHIQVHSIPAVGFTGALGIGLRIL